MVLCSEIGLECCRDQTALTFGKDGHASFTAEGSGLSQHTNLVCVFC